MFEGYLYQKILVLFFSVFSLQIQYSIEFGLPYYAYPRMRFGYPPISYVNHQNPYAREYLMYGANPFHPLNYGGYNYMPRINPIDPSYLNYWISLYNNTLLQADSSKKPDADEMEKSKILTDSEADKEPITILHAEPTQSKNENVRKSEESQQDISVKKRSTKKEVKKSVDPSNPLVPIDIKAEPETTFSVSISSDKSPQDPSMAVADQHDPHGVNLLSFEETIRVVGHPHHQSDMPTNEQLGFISINDMDHPETELVHELTDRRPEDITVKKISRPRRALTSLSAQDKSLTLESQTTIPLPSFNLTQTLCSSFGGHTCESCLLVPDCYFCDSTDKCIPYAFLVQDLFSGAFCPGIRIYYKTCKANFAVIVFVSSLFGLTVLIILISLLIMVIIRKRRLSEIYKKVESKQKELDMIDDGHISD